MCKFGYIIYEFILYIKGSIIKYFIGWVDLKQLGITGLEFTFLSVEMEKVDRVQRYLRGEINKK